jgi:hypothetical protein
VSFVIDSIPKISTPIIKEAPLKLKTTFDCNIGYTCVGGDVLSPLTMSQKTIINVAAFDDWALKLKIKRAVQFSQKSNPCSHFSKPSLIW